MVTYAHEHEKNMTKLWCKIVHKTSVEYTKGNEGPTPIYTHLGIKLKKSFQRGFIYTSSNEASEKPSQLRVDYELTKT
jgi:hypothetical protein